MQKVINTIALLSGLVSLSVLASAGYLYVNKDALLEDARRRATESVTKAIADTLPKMIDSAMPKIPEVTGPAIPSTTGPAIPKLP